MLAGLRLTIENDQLLAIRTQQLYGLICIAFWYLALIISPIGYVIGRHRTKKLEFSRRAIGVSAFYFAALHGGVALWAQLGGFGQLQYLPELFTWSLVAGAVALLVLGLMAATSFDKVIQFMTPRKWKWLHRLVYAAGILAIIHIWSIGTHMAYGGVQWAAFIALVVLTGFELFRVTKLLNEKYLHLAKVEIVSVYMTLWAITVCLIMAIPFFVQNYHSSHASHSSGHSRSME